MNSQHIYPQMVPSRQDQTSKGATVLLPFEAVDPILSRLARNGELE